MDTTDNEDTETVVQSSPADLETPDTTETRTKSAYDTDSAKQETTDDTPAGTPGYVVFYIPRFLFWMWVAIIAFCIVYFAGMFFINRIMFGFKVEEEILEDLGLEGVTLFRNHDRDDDGYLSLEEFEPLAHRLLETNVTSSYELIIHDTDEVVTLHTAFKPILLSSMSSRDNNSQIPGKLDSLHGLKNWLNVNIAHRNLAAKHFKLFLPKGNVDSSSLGKVYNIIKPSQQEKGAPLSSNRYYPPVVSDNEVPLHLMLTMFHSRPFLHSRFAHQVAAACIRAFNDEYIHIIFRIHAEFQLNEPPFYPFWFTPAQFAGHLIIHRDGRHIKYFHMYVPADKKLNIDMEWMNEPREMGNMEVDIGYMPKMAATIAAPSRPVIQNGIDIRNDTINLTDIESITHQMTWKEEISVKEAEKNLQLHFYPFKKVEYHNFTDLFALAHKENKLVHQVLLWGALDDQSC